MRKTKTTGLAIAFVKRPNALAQRIMAALIFMRDILIVFSAVFTSPLWSGNFASYLKETDMHAINVFQENESRRNARANRKIARENLVIAAVGGIVIGVLCAMFI